MRNLFRRLCTSMRFIQENLDLLSAISPLVILEAKKMFVKFLVECRSKHQKSDPVGCQRFDGEKYLRTGSTVWVATTLSKTLVRNLSSKLDEKFGHFIYSEFFFGPNKHVV